MITNNTITFYHKILNPQTKLEEWIRKVFEDVWVFKTKGGNINQGYDNSIDVRIPTIDNTEFEIGDLIAIGVHENITKQSDLQGAEFFKITTINKNDFGNNPHIHLRGA